MSLLRYIYDRLSPASIVDGMDIVFGRDPKSGVCVAVISQSNGSELLINKCTLGFLGNATNGTAAAYVIYFGKKAEVMHVKQWIISQHYLSKHKQLESGAA